VQEKRFWRSGPAKWLRQAARRGALALIAGLMLAGGVALPGSDAVASTDTALEQIENDGDRANRHGGAGGN
jgi:hypothetical protein